MSTYNDYFNSIKSEKEISEISESIVSVRKKQIPVFKRLSVGLAASLTALGASVTAYAAANNWDFSAILDSWFGGKTALLDDCLSDVITENTVDEMENVDISIRGAVCDNGITTFFFDIERTDGNNFNTNPIPRYDYYGNPMLDCNNEQYSDSPNFEFDGDISFYDNEGNTYRTASFIEYIVKDEDPVDNKLTIAAVLHDSDDIYDCLINSENRIKASILFNGIKISHFEPLNEDGDSVEAVDECIEGKWCTTAYFDYSGVNSKTIAVDRNVNMSFANNTYKEDDIRICEDTIDLKEITASNISLMLKFEFNKTTECYYPVIDPEEGIGKLYMKDGSCFTVGGDKTIPHYYICENKFSCRAEKIAIADCNVMYMLSEPIDVNEIDYIEISGENFKF